MTKQIITNYGKLYIRNQYIVNEINEGILFNNNDCMNLINVCQNTFGNVPFGYISNRINNCFVIPTIYMNSSEVENLKAIAIVSANPRARHTAAFEKKFFNKPFAVFSTLREAEYWMKNILNEPIYKKTA